MRPLMNLKRGKIRIISMTEQHQLLSQIAKMNDCPHTLKNQRILVLNLKINNNI